uniref:K Homology domain-containing protein n=1 Tax=Ditylenchus dipsaci TaxID=166011 RepID=A0A915EFG6_9BILA
MNNIKPQVIRELVISGDSVPIIIGTNGSTIKKLQEIYGVKMRFLGENEATYTERTLRITARDVVSADNALQKVEELLRNGPLWTEPAIEKPPQVIRQTTNSNPPYFGAERSAEQHIEDTYMLVYALFDQVAGKNDANFKSIKSSLSLAAMEVAVYVPMTLAKSSVP